MRIKKILAGLPPHSLGTLDSLILLYFFFLPPNLVYNQLLYDAYLPVQ